MAKQIEWQTYETMKDLTWNRANCVSRELYVLKISVANLLFGWYLFTVICWVFYPTKNRRQLQVICPPCCVYWLPTNCHLFQETKERANQRCFSAFKWSRVLVIRWAATARCWGQVVERQMLPRGQKLSEATPCLVDDNTHESADVGSSGTLDKISFIGPRAPIELPLLAASGKKVDWSELSRGTISLVKTTVNRQCTRGEGGEWYCSLCSVNFESDFLHFRVLFFADRLCTLCRCCWPHLKAIDDGLTLFDFGLSSPPHPKCKAKSF